MLDENREACDCPIDCQVINTVKAQSMKSIAKILHLSSVVQSDCYEPSQAKILFILFSNQKGWEPLF